MSTKIGNASILKVYFGDGCVFFSGLFEPQNPNPYFEQTQLNCLVQEMMSKVGRYLSVLSNELSFEKLACKYSVCSLMLSAARAFPTRL